MRRLRLTLNHAQDRVRRPRIGVTARGWDFADDPGLSVCPATGAVRLRANFERPEFQTSNSGVYRKLGLADYDLFDQNVPAGEFRAFGFDHEEQFIQYFGENLAGVAALTTDAYAGDQGWAVAVYAYSSGTEQAEALLECGWAEEADGATGPSVRLFNDGQIQVWHDGVRRATASLSGTAGFGRAVRQYMLVTMERGRGRDLVVRTSLGGAAAIRCDWVDPEDSASRLLPAGRFWWRVPSGGATVSACPIVYDLEGSASTRVYALAEPPGLGETLQDLTGSDRFAIANLAHIVGHPQGGAGTASLRSEDDSGPFVPDGAARLCRARLDLASLDDGVTSPWVWGTHLAYGPVLASTPDEEVDLLAEGLVASAIRLDLPDSAEGLRAEWDVLGPDALEALAPGASVGEGVPVRIDEYDPDGALEPIVWLDGETTAPARRDAYRAQGSRVSMRAVDLLAAARESKARETLPFDGMPLCRPATDGVSAVLLALRELGIRDENTDLPDLDYRLPDVPSGGADRAPGGDWNLAAGEGDAWGQVLDRLFGRAPNVVYGMRPLEPGSYGFKAFEPDATPAPVATLYRSVAAAQAAEPGLSEADAARRLYDDLRTSPLPLEANEVRVTGYDPGARAPIAAVGIWSESADPTLPAVDRPRGWLGRRRDIEYGDPGLTTMAECQRLCQSLYDAATTVADVDSYSAQMPTRTDGTPVWRGEEVELDDHQGGGAARAVRTSSWSVDLADESGAGDLPGQERGASRIASLAGGALLGHGGVGAFEIASLAAERAAGARRFRGFGLMEGVSPVAVGTVS